MDAYGREQPVAAAIQEGTVQRQQNDRDASQLAVNEHDEPEQGAAIHDRNPHDDAIPHDDPGVAFGADQTPGHRLALPSVCTFQELQQMRVVQNVGGKLASAKQKELRQACLQSKAFEMDVTET